MPSGAKKRKAAKKKKIKQTIPSSASNQPQGNTNDLKSKGSDDGSSAHGKDTAAAAAAAKPLQEIPNRSNNINEGVAVIQGDFKSQPNKIVSSVYIESVNQSNYVNGYSDETITTKDSKDEVVNSVKETVHSVKVGTSVSEMKNGDTGNILPEKSLASQVEATDLVMKRNEDKVHPFPDEDVRAASSVEPEAKEFHSKVSSSVSHSATPRSTNCAEHAKGSDAKECPENQPLIASAPHMMQKTSWLSCCGLFEVLSGSNR